MKTTTKNTLVIVYTIFAIGIFTAVLVFEPSREVFKELSSSHAYIMGFIKFALLATAGELIAASITCKQPTVPVKIVWRFIIWGLIGIWITFMMKIYSAAVGGLMANELLPGGNSVFLKALYTSVVMNTTFGPTFMAIHKCTDKLLELKAKKESASLSAVITGVDWTVFVNFTLLKTVPLFWIPAHTVTFLLPPEYQVMMAAALSIALGIILSMGNRMKKSREDENNGNTAS
ncbi:MAG: Mpv17/PMP22 family protein [Clostridia bacterium]|nr:Mpv17/PMP22 family protein [Clostridia bacterium]